MKRELVLEIKQEIGYSEEVKNCKSCKYSVERENPVVDRMWDLECSIVGNLGAFKVTESAHCTRFEKAD